MPRIDPDQLLKTLSSLLDPATGAIRSVNEVDKIYGLMSKYSKKLVSKCTYINILNATPHDRLSFFYDRGGWGMLFTWTSDAVEKKNYDLLREILTLLLNSPVNLKRLKENSLPKLVKAVSKNCPVPDVQELASSVVSKWMKEISGVNSGGVEFPSVVQSSSISSSSKSSLPGDLDGIPDGDILTLSSADLQTAMIDFNPDEFSSAVEHHLGLTDPSATLSNNIDNNVSVSVSNNAINTSAVDTGTRFTIKAETEVAKNAPFCVVMQDGKHFLLKMHMFTPDQAQSTQSVQEISSTSGDVGVNANNSTNSKHVPNILKTYSKKGPVEIIPPGPKPVNEGPAPKEKSKSKSKDKDKEKSREKRSSSKAKAAAEAAAKKAEEEKRLYEKIKMEKAKVKEQLKKKKQEEKDKETLKTLNLTREPSVLNPGGTPTKVGKIPKKANLSFEDAIGIGTAGSDEGPLKIIKRKSSLEKEKDKKAENSKGAEKESKDKDKGGASSEQKDKKERRHNVKVFKSRSSRADELLKDMTENAKPSKKEKEKAKDESVVEKSWAGNSLIFGKPEKRPSLDGVERPGESKKPKLADEKAKREKKAISNVKVIQESNLFITAITEAENKDKNSKRKDIKRRTSLSNSNNGKPSTPTTPTPVGVPRDPKTSPPVVVESPTRELQAYFPKFYTETLCETSESKNNNNEEEEEENPMEVSVIEELPQTQEQVRTEKDDDVIMIDDEKDGGEDEDEERERPFTPTEEELNRPLKSCLVIHRGRNEKVKKGVRWRDDTELTELHTFELDEEERVNVTRTKDFMAMREAERAAEKERLLTSLKERYNLGAVEADMDEGSPWLPLIPLWTGMDPLVIQSRERGIQEERERLNLGVFLPPGSMLPDSPTEPDPTSPSEEREPKQIPMEDVLNVTKVYDIGNIPWPSPKDTAYGFPRRPAAQSQSQLSQPLPFGAPSQGYSTTPTVSQQIDFSNPWNLNTTGGVAGIPTIPDLSRFASVPSTASALGFVPPPSLPNPFALAAAGFPPSMSMIPPPGFPTGIPPPTGIGLLPSPQMRPVLPPRSGGGPGRDQDLRRGFNNRDTDMRGGGGYDRDRSRSGRNDRRDHDRDRDRRSPSPSRRRRGDDHRDRDYRSTRPSRPRKEIPCKFHQRGACHNGSRCEFSHDSNSSYRRRSPTQDENWETEANHQQQEGSNTSFEYERRPSNDAVDFADAPSSPQNSPIMEASMNPVKVIPVE